MWAGVFIDQGAVIPSGYGISYRCWDKRGAMCHRVPLNLLIRWGRNAKFWAMGAISPSWADERMQKIYYLGMEHGRASVDREAVDTLRRIEEKLERVT